MSIGVSMIFFKTKFAYTQKKYVQQGLSYEARGREVETGFMEQSYGKRGKQ